MYLLLKGSSVLIWILQRLHPVPHALQNPSDVFTRDFKLLCVFYGGKLS